MSLCDHNRVVLRTNRARCTLYKKILDLVYKFDHFIHCREIVLFYSIKLITVLY